MQRMSRRPHGWSGPGSAEEVGWLVGAEPPVQVVVVQLRALRPQVPKPPRCSPGAANRACCSHTTNVFNTRMAVSCTISLYVDLP